MRIMGVGLPSVETMAYAGAGFLAPPFLEGFVLPYLPAGIVNNPVGKYVFKLGSVLGVTYLANRFLGRKAARSVAMGGGVYILASAVLDFAPSLMAPGTPAVGGGMNTTMNAYISAGPARSLRGMRAYVPSSGRSFTGMGAPASIAASSGNNSGAIGGTAARFRRV